MGLVTCSINHVDSWHFWLESITSWLIYVSLISVFIQKVYLQDMKEELFFYIYKKVSFLELKSKLISTNNEYINMNNEKLKHNVALFIQITNVNTYQCRKCTINRKRNRNYQYNMSDWLGHYSILDTLDSKQGHIHEMSRSRDLGQNVSLYIGYRIIYEERWDITKNYYSFHTNFMNKTYLV